MKNGLKIPGLDHVVSLAGGSFGGVSLGVNLDRAVAALGAMADVDRMHNRNDGQSMRLMFTLSHHTPEHIAKQVSAEISRIRLAMAEALHSLELKRVDAEILRLNSEELLAIGDAVSALMAKKKVLEASKLDNEIASTLKYVEGAAAEVLFFESFYQELESVHGKFSEERYEQAEPKAHIMRAISQAVRDVRGHDRILNGTQEYLEQCGINPTKAFVEVVNYIQEESRRKEADTGFLTSFINDFAARHADCPAKALADRGLRLTIRKDILAVGGENDRC